MARWRSFSKLSFGFERVDVVPPEPTLLIFFLTESYSHALSEASADQLSDGNLAASAAAASPPIFGASKTVEYKLVGLNSLKARLVRY